MLIYEKQSIAAVRSAILSNFSSGSQPRKLRQKIAAIPRETISRRVIKCKTTSHIADNTLIYSSEKGGP